MNYIYNKRMKKYKYVISLSCLMSLTAFLLLMNCTEQQQNTTGGGDFGFTPDSPTTDNSEGGNDYELDPDNPTRGGVAEYFSVSENQDQYADVYNPDNPVPTTGNSTGSTGNSTGSTGNSTGSTGNSTGSTGNSTGSTGNSTGSTGNSTGSTGNSTGVDPGECTPQSFAKNNIVLENEARWGTSAPLTIRDSLVFEDFRLGEPVNSMGDIANLRVYVRLSKVSGQRYYAGIITVAYQDYGRTNKPNRRIRFQSGTGSNARYNIWLNQDSFHGFFQEDLGALIFVIDDTTEVDCGPDRDDSITLYSGSIWTMQFRTTFRRQNSCNNHDQQYVFQYNQNPIGGERIPTLSERNRKCWFLTNGPFDCRTWRQGNGVNTVRDVEPDDSCYSRLGTFEGLDIKKAFGVNSISDIQR